MSLLDIIQQIEKNLSEVDPHIKKYVPGERLTAPVALGATIVMGRGKNRFVR